MNTELSLIRGEITAPVFTLTPAAVAQRDDYLGGLQKFTACHDYTTAQAISDVAGAAKKFLATVKKERLEITRPIDGFKAMAMKLETELTAPLEKALENSGAMVAAWQLQERKRVEAEEAARRAQEAEALRIAAEAQRKAAEEAARAERIGSEASAARAEKARLQAEAEAMAARELLSQPVQTASKATGSIVRMVCRWEITDPVALYKAMPHFFKLEPNRAVINASVTKTTSLPGLKVWEEAAGGFRAAK